MVVVGIYFAFFRVDDFAVFPSLGMKASPFIDEVTGGKSIAEFFSSDSSKVDFRYQIEDKQDAYAGIDILISDPTEKDFFLFNEVHMEYSTQNVLGFNLSIRTFEKGITQVSNPESFRYNFHFFSPTADNVIHREVLNLKDFKTKDWWKKAYLKNGKLSDIPDWSTARIFALCHEVVNDASAPSTITLRSMTISRNNNGYFLLTSSFLLLYYSCWSFITWLSKRKKKGVIITYKSIEIVESNDDSWQEFVINYIGKEYVNPDLTLNNTANYTGKPIKIVSKFIREKFNLSFNQYLNGIRLEEGKKLMKNSNLSLKEISYQIGYSGGNHFTRVFKQYEDVTPTEYLMTLN